VRTETWALLAAVAAALLSMAAYRLTPAGRASGDRTRRGGSFVLGFWVRNWFYWFLRPLESLCLALRMDPLVFNVLGVALGGVAGVAFARGELPFGGAVMLLSGIADVLDGQIARGRGLVSDAGAFLDSTLDRIAELGVFVGLAWYYGEGWPLVAVTLGLGGSLLVSYTRARGEGLGISCKEGVMQRAERMLLLGLGSILSPTLSGALDREPGSVLFVLLVVVAAGTLGTSVWRIRWITKALEERARGARSDS
jgi:CDP-diacylglycerol--glycerol-3-phosphate 3-phosphatidyltransferase